MNPFERISVGAEGEATTVVTPDITVRHFHAVMPAVYGTPFMIYLMEVATLLPWPRRCHAQLKHRCCVTLLEQRQALAADAQQRYLQIASG